MNETHLRKCIAQNLDILKADCSDDAFCAVDILTVHTCERLLDQLKTLMALGQFTGRVAHNGHALDGKGPTP